MIAKIQNHIDEMLSGDIRREFYVYMTASPSANFENDKFRIEAC